MKLDLARAWLAEHQNSDGSWGYVPGNEGAPEPTLLAGAAGMPIDPTWLSAADLGWGQLMLPAALSRIPDAQAAKERAVAHILEAKGRVVEVEYEFDPSIPAWSWYPDTAPWVEPTSYAVLSLRRAGLHAHNRAQQGIAMILDRQCDDGGWNYGNPAMLGTRLDSELATTGWATLALPTSPATDRGLERLSQALELQSTTNLALATLAHIAHGADGSSFAAALGARQQPDGAFAGRADWTALAACAIEAATTGGCAFFDAKEPS